MTRVLRLRAPYMNAVAKFAPAKLRIPNRPNGTIGSAVRRSQATNASKAATPRTVEPTITGSPHPRRWDSINAYTEALSPTADSPAPVKSTRGCSAGPGIGHSQNVNAKATTIGTAERTEIHRQLRKSTA